MLGQLECASLCPLHKPFAWNVLHTTRSRLRLPPDRLSPGDGGDGARGILPLIQQVAPVVEFLLSCQPEFDGSLDDIRRKEPTDGKVVVEGNVLGRAEIFE